MPNLYTVPTSYWGDMIQFADSGRIITIAKDGSVIPVGQRLEHRLRCQDGARNDDGGEDTCAIIAFKHLGLDSSPLEAYRQAVGIQLPLDDLNELLEKCADRVDCTGTLAEFLHAHQTGKFFVGFHETENAPHAFALVDGTAYNIRFGRIAQPVDYAWRIR